jgi:FKBP-type peptidyl-prolyl cis-trans isomerase FklB
MKTVTGMNHVLLAGIALIALSLTAFDSGADNNSEKAVKPTSIDYNTGYAFGSELARLHRQQPDAELDQVLSGILDALSEADPSLSRAEMCAELTDSDESTVTDTPPIVARTRGFKDDFAALNARRKGVTTLHSGVQYEVLKAGSGRTPAAGDTVVISYQGTLTNGTVFDTTYDDDEPVRMPVDKIAVPGLKQAVLLMQEGAKWRVVVPPSMGFARIGNNQLRRRDLIYDIELKSIEKPVQSSSK